MNPFLFIVGANRSGTTLLRRLVDAHPRVAVTKETHWIPRLLRGKRAVSPEAPVTPDLLARLRTFKEFGDMGVDQSALERLVSREEPISYAEFVTAIFDLYGEARGKRLVGDKVPGYVHDIPLLHALWPRAKFVHLIRDGRDVCSSVLQRRKGGSVTRFSAWDEDPVSTSAVWWERLVRLGTEAGAQLGPDLYREVRYERLVGDPAGECAKLCGFLGIPYDEQMLRFHEGRGRDEPGLSAKGAWLPVTPGLRSWRADMPREDLERFEAVAGDLLDELGYPRGVPDPSADMKAHAVRVRRSFTADLRHKRRGRLPAQWRHDVEVAAR